MRNQTESLPWVSGADELENFSEEIERIAGQYVPSDPELALKVPVCLFLFLKVAVNNPSILTP